MVSTASTHYLARTLALSTDTEEMSSMVLTIVVSAAGYAWPILVAQSNPEIECCLRLFGVVRSAF